MRKKYKHRCTKTQICKSINNKTIRYQNSSRRARHKQNTNKSVIDIKMADPNSKYVRAQIRKGIGTKKHK